MRIIETIKLWLAYIKAYPERQRYAKRYAWPLILAYGFMAVIMLVFFGFIVRDLFQGILDLNTLNRDAWVDDIKVIGLSVMLLVVPSFGLYISLVLGVWKRGMLGPVRFEQTVIERYIERMRQIGEREVGANGHPSDETVFCFIYDADDTRLRENVSVFVPQHVSEVVSKNDGGYVNGQAVTDALVMQLQWLYENKKEPMITERLLGEPFAFYTQRD